MKKIFKLLMLAIATSFALASCEDVPMPYPTPNPNGGEQGGDDVVVEPKGTGTLADPYNVSAIVALIKDMAADTESSDVFYIKGKVASNTTTDATISQYGNMTFTMIDEGNTKTTFTAFQVYGPEKKKFTSVDQIKEGDEVIVCGKVVNYKGNTPETVGKGSAYVVSINGEGEVGGNDQPSTDQPTTGSEINCAKAAELAMALEDKAESAETYTVIGYITETDGQISREQQTFWMADTKDGGKVFEAYWANIPDPTNALPVGTKVKMTGKLMRYGSTPEMKNGQVVVLEMGDGGSTGGDNTGSEDTPTGDAGEYGISVNYSLGANAYDDGVATINGVEGVNTIKIGTSKNPGEFSFKSASGKVVFYAVTWNNVPSADVKFMDGSTNVKTIAVKSNEGATGNAPYTMTVSSTDKYEIEIPAGKTITVTSDKRIIFFGLKEK